MGKKAVWISATTLLLCVSSLIAQRIDSTLSIYSSNYQPERTYLHYDKAAYIPGETIWFKAYLMEGTIAAEGSRTLYVDWTDEKGNILYHTASPVLAGGTANGQFEVPLSYKGRNIYAKAYTRWMLNFDSSFLYQKSIRIIQNNSTTSSLPRLIPVLKFYPEGGDMITGIRSKIAFKTADQWGKPVAINGIIEKNGLVTDSLRIIHDGMGFVYLSPEEDAKYIAKWKDQTGTTYITEFPEAKKEGVSLQVFFQGGKRVFTIQRSAGVTEELKTLHLIGTVHQKLFFEANIDLKKSLSASGILPLRILPSGVLTLTLFDEQWNVLAERVVHVNNEEYRFEVQPELKQLALTRRGRNELEITLPDTIQASLSLSITDGSIENNNGQDIISHFLLSSELRGKINNPSYYFTNNSDTLAQKLDLVMLTNGWRRFKWEEVKEGKMPVITFSKDTTYMALSGRLLKASPAKLQSAGTLLLMVRGKDSITKTAFAEIKKDGSFKTDFIVFDTAQVYYQLPKPLSKAKLEFMTEKMSGVSNSYKKAEPVPLYFDTNRDSYQQQIALQAEELAQGATAKMLQEVVLTARKKNRLELLDEKYTSGFFADRNARARFDVLNDKLSETYINVFYYLLGKVGGLQISMVPNRPEPDIVWRGGTPVLYLDEVPVTGTSLVSIPVSDIAYIKVFSPIFYGAGMSSSVDSGGQYGAIAIYTRRHGDLPPIEVPGLPSSEVVGYSPIREFFSPDYATPVQDNEQTDVRTTLLWKPHILTGKDAGKISIVFYNSDINSKCFRVVIEGMTRDGLLTHYETVIN